MNQQIIAACKSLAGLQAVAAISGFDEVLRFDKRSVRGSIEGLAFELQQLNLPAANFLINTLGNIARDCDRAESDTDVHSVTKRLEAVVNETWGVLHLAAGLEPAHSTN